MTYDPRSIFQAYEQYGKSKSNQSKKTTGLGGRGNIVEKPGERKAYMDKQKPNIDERIWSVAAKWMGMSGGKDDEPEPPAVKPIKVYERKEFDIKPVEVTTQELGPAVGGYDELGRNFGMSMGVDFKDPRGREQRGLPQNVYSQTIGGIMSGTGGRDTPVSTASPKKPGILLRGGERGAPDPETAPVESLINTISTGPKKAGLGEPDNTYTIKKGDTLSEIARAYGTTVEKLVDINNLKDKSGDTIFAGQKIKLIPDAPTVSEPTDAAEAAETFTSDNVDFDFIADQEGRAINTAYVPQDDEGNAEGQSGVTVGTGVDLGSKNKAYFDGLDEDLIEKIEPYFGKKRETAQNLLAIAPLELTDAEVAELDRFVKEKELKTLKDKWNEDSDTDFDDLPTNQATAVASVYYQYGQQMFDHNYWDQTTGGDWEAARNNLMNYGDNYNSRRNREATYLASGEM
mgnify:FL=1